MRTRIVLAGTAGLALAALALPSAAAPDRTASLTRESTVHEWTGKTGTGAVYTSDVSSQVPACSPAFSCDTTLLEVTDAGKLVLSIAGKGVADQDTMVDLDLHLYKSDAEGTQGALVGEGTSPEANETVTVKRLQPGFYLVVVDWYLGAGSYAGRATLTPDPLPVDEPVVVVEESATTGS